MFVRMVVLNSKHASDLHSVPYALFLFFTKLLIIPACCICMSSQKYMFYLLEVITGNMLAVLFMSDS